MAFDDLMGAINISSSGMSAERLRMEVVANNIANAYSTRTPDGGPFRRQDVVFASVLKQQFGAGRSPADKLGGVEVVGLMDDPAPFERILNPGHPDADKEGYVNMPNVHLPIEMVNLITASRAYEANFRVMQAFRQAAEQALTLGRS